VVSSVFVFPHIPSNYWNSVQCQKLQVFGVQSFGLDTGSQSFALSIIRSSKSAEKFAVQMCRVSTVMKATELVIRQFKEFVIQLSIE